MLLAMGNGNGWCDSACTYYGDCCDDKVAIIGCSNMDEQSFNHSREVNLVVEDEALTRGFDQQAFTPVFAIATTKSSRLTFSRDDFQLQFSSPPFGRIAATSTSDTATPEPDTTRPFRK